MRSDIIVPLQFSLQLNQAKFIVQDISLIVANWQSHFASMGVVSRDIEELSQYIDGDFLRLQRLKVLQN
jgi:hypothetical protein